MTQSDRNKMAVVLEQAAASLRDPKADWVEAMGRFEAAIARWVVETQGVEFARGVAARGREHMTAATERAIDEVTPKGLPS